MPSRGLEKGHIITMMAVADVLRCVRGEVPLTEAEHEGQGRPREALWIRCCPVASRRKKVGPEEARKRKEVDRHVPGHLGEGRSTPECRSRLSKEHMCPQGEFQEET